MTATATIDLSAFRHNVRTLTDMVAPSAVMLAVKADAYGHGMHQLAPVALDAGATALAVLEIPAAVALREAGVTAPLFAWLHGVHTDFSLAWKHDIDLGISALWQIDAIVASRPQRPVRVHLKVDTGLHRNGASVEDWPELVTAALAAEHAGAVTVHAAWSHLADTSPADDAESLAQLHSAIGLAEELGAHFPFTHLAASSAGIRMPDARLDFVRFGIAAYGISPFDDVDGRGLGLIPTMTLTTTVLDVDERHGVATIGAGFGDGIAAAALPNAEVFIGGARRMIRAIDVDTSIIEARDDGTEPVTVGDEVVVFGTGDFGDPTAEEWAAWADSIGDEIVTQVAARVPRVYRDGDRRDDETIDGG
jgi:alanine racemase